MASLYTDLAQGEVKDLPEHYEMKWAVRVYDPRHKPFRITLVTDGVNQEVEVLHPRGHGATGDGSWYTELIVCPVDSLESKKGARIIHIDVDPQGHATYL